MQNLFFLLFEVIVIAAFILLLLREIIKRRGYVYILLAGTVFGLLLELASYHVSHAYTYGNFHFMIGGVPLFIAMAWAVIFYLAMSFSNQFEIPWIAKPFIDALIVLNLDLAIDAIAIRAGFWTWVIPLDQEWYGVPFENLAGWILVALIFSFLIRFVGRFNPRRLIIKLAKLALPFVASVIYPILAIIYMALALIPFHASRVFKIPELFSLYKKFSYPSIAFQPEVQLWKLIILVFMIAQLVSISFYFLIKQGRVRHFDFVSFSFFTFFHLFFLAVYFISGMFIQAPFLLFIALAMLGFHFFMHIFLPLGLLQLNWTRRIKNFFLQD